MDNQMNNQPNYNVQDLNKPITMWGYLGYQLLFAIPCVGLVFLFVYGFGSNTNVNLKNFARSYLIMYAIALGISLLMMLFGVSIGLGTALNS